MDIPQKDIEILRRLGSEVAEIATLMVHREREKLWRELNDFEKVRPMLWINEIPWHQMNVGDELTIQCENGFAQGIEGGLRRTIYQWKHMPGDMIVEPLIRSCACVRDTGYGIEQLGTVDPSSGCNSQEFEPQLKGLGDVEKIKMPEVTFDAEQTEINFETMKSVFDGILTVEKYGIGMQWFTLWDNLIRWYGVQEAMMDLVLNPELVHACLDRLLKAFLCRLEQYRELNLLSRCDGNFRIGSGGLGYTNSLPAEGFDPDHVRTLDQWGCGNAQIFSEVSPDMHEEFSLQYEREWMKNFGLNYYGCCEQLHHKIHILDTIPNLRKVSMSPWCDVDRMVENAGSKYVLSHKPNPAILARDEWDPGQARKELVEVLEKTKGCRVEVILKDISTVRNEPERLWDWARIAREVCDDYA